MEGSRCNLLAGPVRFWVCEAAVTFGTVKAPHIQRSSPITRNPCDPIGNHHLRNLTMTHAVHKTSALS